MSFILDALKKSERERQRNSGPTLFEAKVAPPKARLPIWAIAVCVLLVINFAVIGWLLFKGTPAPRETSPPPQTASAPPAQTPALPQPMNTAPQPPAAVPYTAPAPAQASVTPRRPVPVYEEEEEEEPLEVASLEEEGLSEDDFAPAVEPAPRRSAPPAPVNVAELPTYEDIAGNLGLAELRMDLHSYAPSADKRFVFINMQKVGEGETGPQGVLVENITPEGAVLSYRGKRFLLLR